MPGALSKPAEADAPSDLAMAFDWKEAVQPGCYLLALAWATRSPAFGRFYADVLSRFPGGDGEALAKYLFTVPKLLFVAAHWVPMLAYTFVDATRWPKWVYDRRVQPDTEPPTLRHWLKTALVAVTGHLALGVISARFMIPVWARNVDKKGLRSLPDPLRAVATFVGLELAVEFLFYVGHRISHHRWFYKWMHKMHHENKSTFGMASFYTTPFDLVINNSLPAAVPIALSGAHPVILWFFMVWQGVRAVQAHCGYDVPFFNDAKFHDFHHEQFDGNYGINAGFALWDWLFGTAGPYFKHRASLKGGLRQKSADAKTANGIAGEAVHEE